MEPSAYQKKEEFIIPEVGDILKNPLILVTLSWEKINGERIKEVENYLTEQETYSQEWEKYTTDSSWSNTQAVKCAKLYIESLQKLIRLQLRIIEHCNETIEKTREVNEKYYDIKESLFNLDEETIKKRESISKIESEEEEKINKFLDKIREMVDGSEKDYSKMIIHQKILSSFENKQKDNVLNLVVIKRTLSYVFGYIKELEIDRETRQKAYTIFAEIFNLYKITFNEYPFVPQNKLQVEKEWKIRLN